MKVPVATVVKISDNRQRPVFRRAAVHEASVSRAS